MPGPRPRRPQELVEKLAAMKSGAMFPQPRLETPLGHASFPKEIIAAPRPWCEAAFNVVHWADMPRGGHFAALEQPELLLDDVRKFFRRFRG